MTRTLSSKLRLVALLLPIAGLVVACSDDASTADDDDDTDPTGSSTSSSSGGRSSSSSGGSGSSSSSGGRSSSSGGGSTSSSGGSTSSSGGSTSSSGGPVSGPTTCQEAHGNEGCCSADGKTAYYFADGEVASKPCDGADVCTWLGQFYDCAEGPADQDPDGNFPLLCSTPPTGTVSGCEPPPDLCETNADCADTPATPLCDATSGACVACLTSFDCHDAAAPSCGQAGACVAGPSQCTGDDASENADDGFVGAADITPAAGGTTTNVTNHAICGLPDTEADFFKFTATAGDSVTLSLSWADAARDLDIVVTDGTGQTLGIDYWLNPGVVKLDYLAAGTYYVRVTRFDGQVGTAAATPYTLNFTRTTGNHCASATDCAKDTTNSLFRGTCTAAGTCVAIAGAGAVVAGGACDSADDCASGFCALTPFNSNPVKFGICTAGCEADATCGANQVCTTVFQTNFCTPKCTADSECVADPNMEPASGPWAYLACNVATGNCELPE